MTNTTQKTADGTEKERYIRRTTFLNLLKALNGKWIDIGKIAYETGIEKKNYRPINVSVADSNLLRKPFTFRRVVK